jgi:hypothetical protein
MMLAYFFLFILFGILVLTLLLDANIFYNLKASEKGSSDIIDVTDEITNRTKEAEKEVNATIKSVNQHVNTVDGFVTHLVNNLPSKLEICIFCNVALQDSMPGNWDLVVAGCDYLDRNILHCTTTNNQNMQENVSSLLPSSDC